jgi:hypothetical protein
VTAPRSLGRRNLLDDFEVEPTLHGLVLRHDPCGTRTALLSPVRASTLVDAAYAHDCPGAPDA